MSGDLRADPVQVTRFWMQVDRTAGADECWPWTGYSEGGYGRFYIGTRMVGSHELALTFTTGEQRLPDLDTCHGCGNPICCNPKHLRFDTRQSNVDDMVRMGRLHRQEPLLTDDDVRLIRRRREAGAAQSDLAAQFRVSETLISQIVNGHKRIEAGGPIAPRRQYMRKAV